MTPSPLQLAKVLPLGELGELTQLCPLFEVKDIKKNEYIELEMNQAAVIYFGSFKKLYRNKVFEFLGTDDIILNVDNIYSGSESSEISQALEDSVVFIFDYKKVHNVLSRTLSGMKIINHYFQKCFLKKYFKERFHLSSVDYKVKNYDKIINIPMKNINQKDISDYIGILPQSLSRLKRQGKFIFGSQKIS